MSDGEDFCRVCGVQQDGEGRCTMRCPSSPHYDPHHSKSPEIVGLGHLREDVREGARRRLTRECPGDGCDGKTEHRLFEQYPATSTSGAWGKYLNPVYVCVSCGDTHVLRVYETSQEADQPEWGDYQDREVKA